MVYIYLHTNYNLYSTDLLEFERNLRDVAPDVDLAHDGDVLQVDDVESEQLGHGVQNLIVRVDERTLLAVHVLELNVAQP